MGNESEKTKVTAVGQPRANFFNHMSVYGVEFAAAMITILLLACVLSTSIYALFSLTHDIYGSRSGYGALWAAASAIVWLPVFIATYARTRAYAASHPQVYSDSVQRGFTVAYQVLMLLTVVGFAFAAIYSLFMAFITTDDVLRPIVTVTLPSIFAAAVFFGAFVAFFRQPVFTRRVFVIGVSVITTLIVVPTIILSIVSIRHANTVDSHGTPPASRDYYRDDTYRYNDDYNYYQ